jgi:hypothetical protein
MENKLFLFIILLFLSLYTCGRERHQLGPNKEEMINGDPEAEKTDLCPRSILGEEFFKTILFHLTGYLYCICTYQMMDDSKIGRRISFFYVVGEGDIYMY